MEQIPVLTISATDWAESKETKLRDYDLVEIFNSGGSRYDFSENPKNGSHLEDKIRDVIPESIRKRVSAIVAYQFSISGTEGNIYFYVAGTALVKKQSG